MSKPKFCKISVNLGVGSRKSALNLPVELEEGVEDTNTYENELGVLIALFTDAVVSLPTVGGNYTRESVKEAVRTYFELELPTGE
jgi:hypothetical protein